MRANDWVNVAGLTACLWGVYLSLVGVLWQGVVRLFKRNSWIGRVLSEMRIPEASFWGLLCLLFGFLLQLLALSCGGPLAGTGRWYYATDNREAPAEEVKRDWNACADVVDLKFGGFEVSRNAEVLSAPWFAVRECLIGKGYVYEDAKGTRYPSSARTGGK